MAGLGDRQPKKSRAERNIEWIEQYCLEIDGPRKGRPVRLSLADRAELRRMYDDGVANTEPLTGSLAAFLILLHLVGPEVAPHQDYKGPRAEVNVWSLWRAASPELQQYLKRHGGKITCPELGTSFAAAA